MHASALLVNLLKVCAGLDPFIGPEANGYLVLTVSRLRPFARRRLSTNRPFLVLIRTRNPCVFRRRRTFGWNVLFPFDISPRFETNRQC
jgi:hypothetical protein